MSKAVTITLNPVNEITKDIENQITKESTSETDNLTNQKEKTILMDKVLLDEWGFNLNLDTTDELRSRTRLTNTFTTPKQTRR